MKEGGSVSDNCKGCAYAVRLSGDWCCDYLNLTGRRRPCPPGEECTVRAEGGGEAKRIWKENAPMKGRSWDTEKAMALYSEGKTDREIAEAVFASPGVVGVWRRKRQSRPLSRLQRRGHPPLIRLRRRNGPWPCPKREAKWSCPWR